MQAGDPGEQRPFGADVSPASVTWFTKLAPHVFFHFDRDPRFHARGRIPGMAFGHEKIQGPVAPDGWLAQHLHGMPQLVADGHDHVAGRSSCVDEDPQDPVWPRNR